MHPLVARRDAARSIAHAALRAADASFERDLERRLDPARLRPATPADVRVGAVLWYPHDGGGHAWSVVRQADDLEGGAFMDEDGGCHPFLDNWLVLEGEAAGELPVEAILDEDVRAGAREVWLQDRGDFLVPDEVHPAWWSSASWRLLMRQRRSLRLYVPASEMPRLTALTKVLKVALRGFEMALASNRHRDRYREWQEELARLEAAGDPARIAEHRAQEVPLLKAGLSGVAAHAAVIERFAPEWNSPIKTLPFAPPPPVKAEDAKPPKADPASRQQGRPRRDPASATGAVQ